MLKPILYDANEYSHPEEFNPGHFLDEDGKFMKRENFIPFSIGTMHLFPKASKLTFKQFGLSC